MPTSPKRPARNSHVVLWIVLGSLLVVGSFGVCLIAGVFIWWKPSAVDGLGFSRAAIDTDNVENTRAWVADAVTRLKESGHSATESSRIDKELKAALLDKKVRWTFPVEAVDEGEVKLDTFFGASGEPFLGDDPRLKGKPTRRVYFRIYLKEEKDNVKVGMKSPQRRPTYCGRGVNGLWPAM